MTSPQDEAPRQRLARLMDERRGALRLTWVQLADRAGLTKEGLRGVRFGKSPMRTLTKTGIEDALQWEHSSIDAILAGGEPTPVPAAPPKPGRRESDLADLTVSELTERVEQLLEKKAERRREDELLDQEVARVLEQLRNRDREAG